MIAPRSAHVPLQSARDAMEIVAESALFQGPRTERDLHIVQRVATLFGSRVSTLVDFSGYIPGHDPFIERATDFGWDSDSERSAFITYIGGGVDADPFLRRFVDQPGRLATFRRQDLLADEDWYGSDHYNALRKPSRVDHCIYATVRLDSGDRAVSVGVHRPTADGPFTPRDRALFDLLLHGLAPVLARPEAPDPLHTLPPRLRRVARGMLDGLGAKQIAEQLGVSLQTVYTYSKQIYRALGVQDRQEFQARHGSTHGHPR